MLGSLQAALMKVVLPLSFFQFHVRISSEKKIYLLNSRLSEENGMKEKGMGEGGIVFTSLWGL